MADFIGYVAALISTFSLLPQVLKALRTRSTRDVSLGMFLAICSAGFLWLIYGIMLSSWPIIVANSIGLMLSVTIVILKLRYG
ncbi:MAG: SemiSWEET transporter [Spirochaetes bacterium]|nr:SemiSWEET transporter [Spirochaetota bacterium]